MWLQHAPIWPKDIRRQVLWKPSIRIIFILLWRNFLIFPDILNLKTDVSCLWYFSHSSRLHWNHTGLPMTLANIIIITPMMSSIGVISKCQTVRHAGIGLWSAWLPRKIRSQGEIGWVRYPQDFKNIRKSDILSWKEGSHVHCRNYSSVFFNIITSLCKNFFNFIRHIDRLICYWEVLIDTDMIWQNLIWPTSSHLAFLKVYEKLSLFFNSCTEIKPEPEGTLTSHILSLDHGWICAVVNI